MRRQRRVPEVLWRLFQNHARTLAQTLLSFIPECQCLLLTQDGDPSDYRYLLNHCFVVVSNNAPSHPPFDRHSRYPQIEVVRRTIEIILSENTSTGNLICAGYNKHKRSSTIVEALTSSSWSLLLKRVGDGLMVHLLKHCSIFVPVNRKKHHQVAGIAINDLCWEYLKQQRIPHSINPSGVPAKADSISSMNINIPESSHGDSTNDFVDLSEKNGVLTRKRLRSNVCRRKRKHRKLSSQFDTKSSVPEIKTCPCCSIWQSLEKIPTEKQINKRPMLYKVERTSSILPKNHIINSLRPDASGANALFKAIFGVCLDVQVTECTHSNGGMCVVRGTCLYHSLHKQLRLLIRKAIHCPRVKLLNKHIFIEGASSISKVVSFVWAACMNIIPYKLVGSWRILRKNISKFIRLRIHEKFSLHQCMYKLKLSEFQFVSDVCFNNRKLLERWIYWLLASLVVPLLQDNFYVTDSEHGKLQVFYYEKSVWEKLVKTSTGECYTAVNVPFVKQIIRSRRFGFSTVRFRPKANGIRPLANLKAVNFVLQDLHATLKDVQVKDSEKLGSSVFSYNDVHRNLRAFLSRVKNGSNMLPCVYTVVADVQKAYDSINQDKLLHLMNDVIVDDHLLRQTHQIIASDRHFQVIPYINLCKQFPSHAQNRSSHSIVVDQGRSRTATKDDLHFNLRQHVKNNILYIDKRFYQQTVGIPQGSILSSLLCSFYFGHMENTELVPFLDKVTKSELPDQSDYMLLRFIDDFLFITTSKSVAIEFFNRLDRGFYKYNCNMNKEKFGLSFDSDQIKSKSNRSDVDENGNKFVRWSGLLINCKTLEVQADYTRYLHGHLRSTLTVCWQGNPCQHFRKKICDYLRPKCHAIFYDSNINSAAVVKLNIHQAFLLCAMKFHCYAYDLSSVCSFDMRSYLDIICNSLSYMYRLMKRRVYSLQVDPGLQPILKVKRREVEWLGLTAYIEVLKRKQSRYSDLLDILDLKLKSINIESPDLKFAVDKSNSSVLWKIKY